MQESIDEWKQKAEDGASIRISCYKIIYIGTVAAQDSTIEKIRNEMEQLNKDLANQEKVRLNLENIMQVTNLLYFRI